MSFNWNAAQHEVNLVVGIAKSFKVFEDTQACLAVRHGGVHIVLLAVLVDGEPLCECISRDPLENLTMYRNIACDQEKIVAALDLECRSATCRLSYQAWLGRS